MKFVYLCFVAILSLFILVGCEVETKEKHSKGDFITGGKDRSITEGFSDSPPPTVIVPKQNSDEAQ